MIAVVVLSPYILIISQLFDHTSVIFAFFKLEVIFILKNISLWKAPIPFLKHNRNISDHHY